MTKAPNRLAQFGIISLAGIAILGWIREPERHAVADANAGRATFQYQAAPVVRPEVSEFSGIAVPSEPSRGMVVPSPAEQLGESSVVLQRRARTRNAAASDSPAASHSAASPGGQRSVEEASAVREQPKIKAPVRPAASPQASASTGQDSVPGQIPERTDEGLRSRPREPEVVADHRTDSRTNPVVRTKQDQRSTKQSAMIIGGAAAAGAAIGAMTGGGKGAAIGAISGGAGGYVYDRVTRNRSGASQNGSVTRDRDDRSIDDDSNDERYDHFSNRFATPGFAGR